MQSLGRKYARYFNINYRRSGTLWEGRYKSTPVDTECYFLTVSRYIELNPVRANMVKTPIEYSRSNYQANATGIRIQLLTPHRIYLALRKTNSNH
jgi:putative transposase